MKSLLVWPVQPPVLQWLPIAAGSHGRRDILSLFRLHSARGECFLLAQEQQQQQASERRLVDIKGCRSRRRCWRDSADHRSMEELKNTTPARFRKACVFCGSSSGRKQSYQEAAVELGKELVERNIDLVYGGGSIGLMGLVSQAVHDGGRHVLGVIPKSLMASEITGKTVGEIRTVSDMHERKALMSRLSDAFIALPGGYGTLEELLEVITWAQLGIHNKPVGLLNVDGYYNSLLSFVDEAVDEGFISQISRGIIVSAPSAKELFRKLEEYKPELDEAVAKLNWEVGKELGFAS